MLLSAMALGLGATVARLDDHTGGIPPAVIARFNEFGHGEGTVSARAPLDDRRSRVGRGPERASSDETDRSRPDNHASYLASATVNQTIWFDDETGGPCSSTATAATAGDCAYILNMASLLRPRRPDADRAPHEERVHSGDQP
jgi:hypothetical protein